MRLTITRDQLQQGLQRVVPATASKANQLPVLSHVLLEATKDGLRLYGTDLEVMVGTNVPAAVDLPGVVVTPAKRLMEICKELPSGSVRLALGPAPKPWKGGSGLRVECHRSKFTLQVLGAEDFPQPPAMSFTSPWVVNASVLRELVGHVSYAASREESRPILNGVLWELSKDRMRMVATDGHRLALMDTPVAGGRQGAPDVIIPPRSLKLVTSLFGADEDVEIAVSETHIGFRTPYSQLVTRLIQGPYANYEKVLPTDLPLAATMDRASLIACLRRMAVVASSETHRVKIELKPGTATFSVMTPDLGDAEEPLTITYEGKPFRVEFNARYLLDLLATIPTDEVQIRFVDPERAVTFNPVAWDDDASLTALVMPLRKGEIPKPAAEPEDGEAAA